MGFELNRVEKEATVFLRVSGDVDVNTTPDLLKSVKAAFKSGKSEIVIDLGNVENMDSSGIALLVEGVRDSKKTGTPFLLARVPNIVQGVIDLAKLTDFFTYFEE